MDDMHKIANNIAQKPRKGCGQIYWKYSRSFV